MRVRLALGPLPACAARISVSDYATVASPRRLSASQATCVFCDETPVL